MKISVYNSDVYDIEKNDSGYIISRKDGKELDLELKDNNTKVVIRLLGSIKVLDLEWLYFVSKHNPKFPKNYEQEVFNLRYHKAWISKPKNLFKYVVVFDTPVYYTDDVAKGEYRLIARNPMYAISPYGKVYGIKYREFLKECYPNTEKTSVAASLFKYPIVRMGNGAMIHRLVAETWIKNDDYENKIIVDHIDADKGNYSVNNLRWCTVADNNKYQLEQNVKPDNMPVISRNIDTGEEKEHLSITLACEYMGRSKINTYQQPLEPNKIWKGENGRFELKFKDDERDWFYVDKKENERNNISQTLITFKNGNDVREYKSAMEAAKDLLGYPTVKGFEYLLTCVKHKYPNSEISYKTGRMLQAKRLKDGLIVEAPSTIALIEKIGEGFKKSTVNKYALLKKSLNGWLFRPKPDDPDIPWVCLGDSGDVRNKPKKIISLSVKTNKYQIFPSLRQAASFYGIEKSNLKYYIETGKLFRNEFKLTKSPLEE